MSIGGLIAGSEGALVEAQIGVAAVTGIGAVTATGVKAVESTTQAVAKAVESDVKNALSTVASTAGTIFQSISSKIGHAIDAVTKILLDITTQINKFLSPILKLLNSINALFTVIGNVYSAVTTLIDEIHADIHNGIKGLLAIPGAITNALTSIDASLTRALTVLQQNAQDTAKNILIPGLQDTVGNPLTGVDQSFKDLVTSSFKLPEDFGLGTIEECTSTSYADIITKYASQWMPAATDVLGKIGHVILGVLLTGDFILAAAQGAIRCTEQQANKVTLSGLLGVGDVVEALYRGSITEAQAADEVARQSINSSRFDVLLKNSLWLPSVAETLQMYYRGSLTQEQASAALEKLKLDPEFAGAMQKAFLQPVNPREMAQLWGREQVFSSGWPGPSVQNEPPSDVVNAYPPRFAQPEIAHWDWQSHWEIPNLDWWLTGWARGYVTQQDVEKAALARNVPPEIIPQLFPIWQQTVQLWMLPDMVKLGVFSDQEARNFAHYLGIGDRDAEILVKYGHIQTKIPASVQAEQLAGVSAANAKSMYEDGIINEATYMEILAAHGIEPQAANLIVALAKQQLDLTARKNYVTGLIAEVNAGLLPETDLISQLYSNGYTDAEVAAAVNKVKAAKTAAAKQPTKADAIEFLRYGLLSGDNFIALLVALGYTQAASLDYYNLEVLKHGAVPLPATVSGAIQTNSGITPATTG